MNGCIILSHDDRMTVKSGPIINQRNTSITVQIILYTSQRNVAPCMEALFKERHIVTNNCQTREPYIYIEWSTARRVLALAEDKR